MLSYGRIMSPQSPSATSPTPMPSGTELFREAPRVFYEAAPITEVICQLRYPSILRIERTPDEFQDAVRHEFPLFQRAHNPALSQLPPEIIEAIGERVSPINYHFRTEDQTTTLSLSPDAIALSTKSYARWEDFRSLLRLALAALVRVYKPAFYNRVGLRYQNAIQRSRLGLEDQPWSHLLTPEVLGELSLPQFEEHVLEVGHQLRARLPDGSGAVLLQHGLGKHPSGENVYIIDLDFYTDQKTEVSNAEPILDFFNQRAGWGFRWCITDALHNALRPRPIPDVVAGV
jgi:uncharacterized protein (TIGR04255 family)